MPAEPDLAATTDPSAPSHQSQQSSQSGQSGQAQQAQQAQRCRTSHLPPVAALLTGAALSLAAFATAPVAALVSRMVWRPEPVTLPYGLLLSAMGSMAVVVLAGAASRVFTFVAGVAWLVGLSLVVRNTPGGGFLVAGDGLGWAFIVVDTVAVAGAVLWGSSRR